MGDVVLAGADDAHGAGEGASGGAASAAVDATWNIRRFGEGKRLPESLAMIAASIRTLDLVAIVEPCEDVSDHHRVLRVLGGRWRTVYSDYLTDAGGNRERIGFVFDTARVAFTGLASCAEGERRLVGNRYIEAVGASQGSSSP